MESVAIVGMACRFPDANNPEELWELLYNSRNAITEVPPERWNIDDYYAPPPAKMGKMSTRWGGFIEHADKFDASFFGISSREARYMDPQQRIVLEVAWEALERSGIVPASLTGSDTGVFIGVSNYDYNRLMCRDVLTMDALSGTGTILAIVANRLSYILNLRGPSIAIDTACSSSLVSIHLACQSLLTGEIDCAIAGGVNLILSPEVTIILSQAGLMSPDGRCKTFDACANGYVRSEGCGIVILKRYSDAVRDGNEVLALIRGSAVNQDGATNGLTAPSSTAQQRVIRQALKKARIFPNQLSYVEAHGSGTALGDIIETRALKAVLLENRSDKDACAIGSIKTNIGHAESAAGVAGLMKVVLSLEHSVIPANLHIQTLNPHIRFGNTPLFIPTKACPWISRNSPRLAGISSFGIGGTNVHIIIEEFPKAATTESNSAQTNHIPPLFAGTHHFERKRFWFDEEKG
jgi:acyl transferase domain-containing protein